MLYVCVCFLLWYILCVCVCVCSLLISHLCLHLKPPQVFALHTFMEGDYGDVISSKPTSRMFSTLLDYVVSLPLPSPLSVGSFTPQGFVFVRKCIEVIEARGKRSISLAISSSSSLYFFFFHLLPVQVWMRKASIESLASSQRLPDWSRMPWSGERSTRLT